MHFETTYRPVSCEENNVMKIPLIQTCLAWVFSATLMATALAQSTSKEEELQQKEAELQKKRRILIGSALSSKALANSSDSRRLRKA